MNFLLVNYEYPPVGGGAANASWHIARALLKHGHSVSVITSAFGALNGYSCEDGTHVYRVRSWRRLKYRSNIKEMTSFMFAALFSAHRIVRQKDINGTIVFFTLPCGPVGLMLKKMYGIPYVVSLRGGDVPGAEPSLDTMHRGLKVMRYCVLESAKSIAANSHGLAELSRKTDPFPVRIIPNGVDAEFFKPLEKRESHAFRFIFAGRFQEQKNLFFLLSQLAELNRETPVPFEIDLVGDGPLRKDLTTHAENLGISKKVSWHGWADKNGLLSLYQQADCMLNPSLYEGMPNTVLEAMACGLPVIASDVIGNRDLVQNNETGLLFPLDRPEEFRRAMSELLMNRNRCKLLGENARNTAVKEFSWDKTAFRYEELFF
ncbi:MAG: glycosyltransferase family 4 protein [Planctomycetes bacterium]|nr:glycosyltransferase family 4 protein [Planctomycetota bacterium]